MHYRLIGLVSIFLFVLGGCGKAEEMEPISDEVPETVEVIPELPEEPEEPNDIDINDSINTEMLISVDGMGQAQLGMTLGELKALLPDETDYTVESPFIVDFDAIAVRQGDDVEFYLLHLAGEPFNDDDIIQGILTTNPKYQTAEGIGVGSSIQQAEEVYGTATLSYNLANESREYVRFENHPGGNMAFGLRGGGTESQDFLGVYPNPSAEYNETQDYVDGATIQTVLLVCVTEACTS